MILEAETAVISPVFRQAILVRIDPEIEPADLVPRQLAIAIPIQCRQLSNRHRLIARTQHHRSPRRNRPRSSTPRNRRHNLVERPDDRA